MDIIEVSQNGKEALKMNLEEKGEKAKKKKILVVLTGGTIGSVCTDGVRGIAGDSPYLLLRAFRAVCPDYADCEFEVISPCHLLSENLSCEVWETLYVAISEKLAADRYRGIIVTHGSDTLAYTAAALGMLLRHTPCPVVLTAADRPVNDPRGNGIGNFRAAVDFILRGGCRGVFVSYRRCADGAQVIYLAARLRSADCFCDEFSSYGGAVFGVMNESVFCPDASPLNPAAEIRRAPLSPLAPPAIRLSDKKIMLLRAYPGLDYAAISPDGFAAVVHYGYHSATACTEGGDRSLLRFAKRCRACGTDLWLGSFKQTENELYDTSRELLDNGILPFFDMSPEAAYAKAVIAYHLPDADPKAFMRRCVYYEMVGHTVND